MNKLKIINDPIYGFITIPSELIYDIIEHRYFQRLRRISQMGLSYLVYPGANHTRFQHAIGCLHLMQKAVNVLKFKGVSISNQEEEALLIAILLHDIGHGPFSHALEHSIIDDLTHEELSLQFMHEMNKEFNGKLDLAIKIFNGKHKRLFFNQLVASQLDIDRLDYLKRDSFFTGVAEGNVNSERLITMLNVVNNELVVEEKGLYSVEKFLIARRFMYWQVYLHKAGLVAEKTLVKCLQRAKELVSRDVALFASKTLFKFLQTKINKDNLNKPILENFSNLDDYDIVSAIKQWQYHEDKILVYLSKEIIQRKLPKGILQETKFDRVKMEQITNKIGNFMNVPKKDLHYLFYKGKVKNVTYNKELNPIKILCKNGEIKEMMELSKTLILGKNSLPEIKYYISYPKELRL